MDSYLAMDENWIKQRATKDHKSTYEPIGANFWKSSDVDPCVHICRRVLSADLPLQIRLWYFSWAKGYNVRGPQGKRAVDYASNCKPFQAHQSWKKDLIW